MKCQSCNSELVPGARFCDKCGAPVQELWTPPQAGPEMVSEPTVVNPSAQPFTPPPAAESYSSPAPVDPNPAPYQSTSVPVDFQPSANYATSAPTGVLAADDKFFGMQRSQLGTITLILGIIGLVFSCVGCGGIPAIAGLITGIASLKSTSDSKGKIGLVLCSLALIVAIIVTCVGGSLIIYNKNGLG